MFGFLKGLAPGMMEGMLKTFLTPERLEPVLQVARLKTVMLEQEAGSPVTFTLAMDPATGNFVASLFRLEAGQFVQWRAWPVATGADLFAIISLFTGGEAEMPAFNQLPTHDLQPGHTALTDSTGRAELPAGDTVADSFAGQPTAGASDAASAGG